MATSMAAAPVPVEVYGVDLTACDSKVAPPTVTRLDDDGLDEWFKSAPSDPDAAVHVLCVRLRPDAAACTPAALAALLATPRFNGLLNAAVWGNEIYRSLAANAGGGAVGLADEPFRFILRTPDDGGPFCSFAVASKRPVAKAVFFFNHDVFDPARMAGAELARSAWRATGLQVTTLARMVVRAQSAHLSAPALADVIARVAAIEDTLSAALDLPRDHPTLGRTLHRANRTLTDIERRTRFEQATLDAIEGLAVAGRAYGAVAGQPWAELGPERMAAGTRAYEFASLPRRIENARATLAGLLQRRTEQLNLELALSSERIAEASFADSKSMKTIAILTMVFLPGTAVASLFSMSMFDWSSPHGGGLASKWLWIYFVVTVPLTGLVLAVWWAWGRRVEQQTRRIYQEREARRSERYEDAERGLLAVSGEDADGEAYPLDDVAPALKAND